MLLLFFYFQLIKNSFAERLRPLTEHILTLDLTPFKLSDDTELQIATIELYRNLFATQDVPTIETVFQ